MESDWENLDHDWAYFYESLWTRIRKVEEDVVHQGRMVDEFYRLTSEALLQDKWIDMTS